MLYVSDKQNIKLFKYSIHNKLWEKNYCILKHNDFITKNIEIQKYANTNIIVAYGENNEKKKFIANYSMYKLDDIIE